MLNLLSFRVSAGECFRMSNGCLFIFCLVMSAVFGSWQPLLAEQSSRALHKIVMLAGQEEAGDAEPGGSAREILETLQDLLENSTVGERVRVEVHARGWPDQPETLDDADTIVIFTRKSPDGRWEHPLQHADRWERIRQQWARGCGLMFLASTLEVPTRRVEEMLQWVGGAIDEKNAVEAGEKGQHQRLGANVSPGDASHPVTFGWTSFPLPTRFQGPVTFRDSGTRPRPIMIAQLADEQPSEESAESFAETSGELIGWSVERENGGRGLASTVDLTPETLAISGLRKFLLGGIAWTAGLPVPPTGLDFEEERPFRVIIVTGRQHPRNDGPATSETLRKIVGEDPRAEIEVIPDVRFVASHQLHDYDVVLLNDRDWHDVEALSDDGQANFLRYLKQGGGVVILPTGDPAAARGRVTGRDDPLATRPWWGPGMEGGTAGRVGEGRVLRIAPGFGDDFIGNSETARHLRRGTAWAAGRIPQVPSLTENLIGGGRRSRNSDDVPEISLSVLDEDHFEGFNEAHVVDDRLGRMDTGPLYSGTIATPGGETWKGLVIRVGDQRQASVCFDTELLRVSAAWDGYLNFSPARFGLIQLPGPATEPFLTTPRRPGWAVEGSFADPRPHAPHGSLPRDWGRYRGLHLHGGRVVVSYEVQGVSVLESPWWEEIEGQAFVTRTLRISPNAQPLEMMLAAGNALVLLPEHPDSIRLSRRPLEGTYLEFAPHAEARQVTVVFPRGRELTEERATQLAKRLTPTPDLTSWTRPGDRRWPEVLETQGELGAEEDAYVLDTLSMPYENPYGALMFASGHDFFSNGDAAVCTVHGDVWRVSGITADLRKLRWQRFATGLFQPLGLLVVDDLVHVVGRDQITILRDQNGDGEADFYQNFNNDGHVTANGHEYVTCLERDSEGWFYFLKGDSGGATAHDGCLLRVSPDGETLEVHATGIRNGNGLGIGPNDIITLSPQEGTWTPASAIFEVRPGGFFGLMPSHHRETPPETFDPPLCWIPRTLDNSSGGQTWVTSDRWGPLKGSLLHFSFGRCRLLLVLRETVAGQPQGGVTPLPLQFLSGAMRGRFREDDGQLYVTGLTGWVTSAVKEGCFQRVRYTGRPARLPISLNAHENGLLIGFTEPLRKEVAEQLPNYSIQQWEYRWSGEYGSPEFRPSDRRRRGRDPVAIRSATLLEDGKSLFLEIPHLQPVMQMSIQFALQTADGEPIRSSIDHTIHRLGPAFSLPPRGESELADVRGDVDPNGPAPLARLRRGVWMEYEQRVEREGATRVADTQDESTQHEKDTKARGDDEHENRSLRQASLGRMVAWEVTDGEPVSPFLRPGPFNIRLTGAIEAPLRGMYRFRLEGTGAAQLTINGLRVLDVLGAERATHGRRGFDVHPSPPILLNTGWNRLELDYESTPTGTGRLRLLWSGDGFAEEPVPPEVLATMIPDEGVIGDGRSLTLLDRGRELYGRAGCGNCHANDSRLAAEQIRSPFRNRGPDLSFAGQRYESAWLHRWLLDPTSLRNDTWMPELLSRDEQGQQQAADLVAFLETLQRPLADARTEQIRPRDFDASPEPSPEPRGSKLADRDQVHEWHHVGATLYERRGCIGCHHFESPGHDDPHRRVSLHFVGAKQTVEALAAYLERPHQFRETGARMPDMQLTAKEAIALAHFLQDRAEGRIDDPSTPQGDPLRGRQLFEELACVQCHAVSQLDIRSAGPRLSSVFGFTGDADGLDSGCLAPTSERASRIPQYRLAPEDRAALRALAATDGRSVIQESARDYARQAIRWLRCTTCHDHDMELASWPEILTEEGEFGHFPDQIPSLTWSGEKLRGDWVRRLLAGKLSYRARPWIEARMPAFPEYADGLSEGLAALHGVSWPGNSGKESTPAADSPTAAELAIAQRLLTPMGLDCRQCHALSDQVLHNENLAQGIGLSYIHERLRPEFYHRWMRDPIRVDPTTKMPQFSQDGRTTQARHIAGGDARRQYQAIWEYLGSSMLREEAAAAKVQGVE